MTFMCYFKSDEMKDWKLQNDVQDTNGRNLIAIGGFLIDYFREISCLSYMS